MSRDIRRVSLTPGFVLHQRPYRDTSLIVELYTREYGRLGCFARAVRGPRPNARFTGLQPFRPLLFSWSGRGEAPQLVAVEPDGPGLSLPPERLLAGFYLNELLLKLTMQHDPQPELHDCYRQALLALTLDDGIEHCLRRFEKQLLEQLGYGVDFAHLAEAGEPVAADGRYSLRSGHGIVVAASGASDAVSGHVLLALAGGLPLASPDEQKQARALLRRALEHCLEGRELTTRRVAREVARLERAT